MKYENTIRRLQNAGYQVVRNIHESRMRPGTQYEDGFAARRLGSIRRIEATKQDDEVCTMRVIRDNDKDEMQGDYHAGTWVDTVKRAVELAELN